MKCERCDEKAIFHITDLAEDGGVSEAHLCLKHANKHLRTEAPAVSADTAEGEPVDPPAAPEPCPTCGLTFAEFRETGRLGCPHDYRSFEAELRPLLESVHEGHRHQGKSPRHAPPARRTVDLVQLRKELRDAVGREDYEAAASLRDRIGQVERAARG